MKAVSGFAKDPAIDGILAYLGWVRQREMRREPSWQNVDLDLDGLLQAVGNDTFIAVHKAGEEETAGIPGHRLGAVLAAVWAAQCRRGMTGLEDLSAEAAGGAMGKFCSVVTDERNRLALARIPPERDAVLVWGAYHLRGLAAGLEERGYVQVSEEWIRVGRLPGRVKGNMILAREALLSLAGM
jgi:hypothetical protein